MINEKLEYISKRGIGLIFIIGGFLFALINIFHPNPNGLVLSAIYLVGGNILFYMKSITPP